MAYLDPEEGFNALKDRVTQSLQEVFPIVGKKRTLRLSQVEVQDNKTPDDIRSQLKAKESGQSWTVPVKASLELVDNETGKVIDRSSQRILNLPKMTNRYSFIQDGKEYQVDSLWQLKSGPYARENEKGALEVKFNRRGKFGFHLDFDPEKAQFSLRKKSSNIPLYPVLKEIGVSDSQLEQAWGKKILEQNKKEDPKALVRLFQAVNSRKPTKEELKTFASEFFMGAEMDPEVTKATLGVEKSVVDGDVLVRGAEKLLNISRGNTTPDDRDDIRFKKFKAVDDFMAEAIKDRSKDVTRKIGLNLDRKDKIREVISSDMLSAPIRTVLAHTSLSNYPEQTNPLEILNNATRTTVLGDFGGMRKENLIPTDTKLVNPSHLGFLDPLVTPESGRSGVSLHLPLGVQKKGDTVVSKLYNIRTGKLEDVDPRKAVQSNVVLPDQVRWEAGKPVPIRKNVRMSGTDNEFVEGSFAKADYVIPTAAQLFAASTNLSPFLATTSPNRSTMAGRHMSQALALKEREPRLTESVLVSDRPNSSVQDFLGKLSSHVSPVEGTVKEVKRDGIVIKQPDGTTKEVQIYHNFPLNSDQSYITSAPKVAVGDSVKKGQVIADTNFTKDGKIALGTHLNTGYMAWKGRNFEDGVVVSESAAKRLTSQHMYRHNIAAKDEGLVLSKDKFLAHTVTPKDQAEKLDADGVIKPGSIVRPGDVLIGALKPIDDKHELNARRAMSRRHFRLYNAVPTTWEKEDLGRVVKVIKKGDKAEVYVKAESPARIGDKIAGSYGDKGIITEIIPDAEMPKTRDGKALDLLVNPAGIPGRINLGQVLETVTNKIAVKTGKPYTVQNFDGTADLHAKVQKDMKEAGLTDKEDVIDPKTGQVMGKVLVGPRYIHKLKHQVEKKISGRAGGAGYAYDVNRIPQRGGVHGGQALDALGIYAMLAHGAVDNLRESVTYKADAAQNDKVWMRLQNGDPLPPPQPTFAYNKFVGMMKVLGVNMEKTGNNINLTPLTDKQVLSMSNGELKAGGLMLKARTWAPEKDGLFDPKVTGGFDGDKWSHIKLPTRMPNPIFEKGIVSLTGIREKDLEEIMAGKTNVDPKTGKLVPSTEGGLHTGEAVEHLLSRVDVKKELKASEKQLESPGLKAERLDAVNKRLKYLRMLDKLEMKPTEAYMQQYVPVMPPTFRPPGVLPNGTFLKDDVNQMYKELSISTELARGANKALPESVSKAHASVYDTLKALTGLGATRKTEFRGVMDIIRGRTYDKEGQQGGKPSMGFFQDKLVRKRQDLSLRSTIIPEPELGLDEVGLPRQAAMEAYRPFVIRALRQNQGLTALQARDEVDNKTSSAHAMLEKVVEERPIYLKRDPVLHKYGIQAFKPKLISGKAIKIHPLVCQGYNADFDGDSILSSIVTWLPNRVYNANYCKWSQHRVTTSFVRRMFMSARYDVVLPILENGEFVICHLKDFPTENGVGMTGRDRDIELYTVPEGVKVFALDEKTNRVVLTEVAYWSFHPQREVEIVNLSSGRQIITDDDERAVYGVDASSLEWCRRRPSEAKNQFVPTTEWVYVPDRDSLRETVKSSLCLGNIKEDIPLTWEFGKVLGMLIGDGWVSGNRQVCLSTIYPERETIFKACLPAIFKNVPHVWSTESGQDKFENSSGSKKLVISSVEMASLIEPLIGKGAENKHLPSFFYESPAPFLMGLVSGLWESDGSVSWSHAKDKKQFLCNYSSVSLRLVQELQHLFRMYGISSTITSDARRMDYNGKDNPAWVLNVSIVDLYDAGGFEVSRPDCKKIMEEFLAGPRPDSKMAYSRYRLVPIPSALSAELRKLVSHKTQASIYTTLGKAIDRQYMSKETARRVIDLVKDSCSHPLYKKWKALVDSDLVFDRVESYQKTGVREDGYDLTVPGFETFMSVDGVILSNTMSGFVPITNEAVAEARKMFPSNNLFSPATGRVMYTPTNESQLGIYMLNRVDKSKNVAFASLAEAARAVKDGKIDYTNLVTINGIKTTVGRSLLADAVPEAYRKDILHGKMSLDGKQQSDLLANIAKENKNDYATVVNKLKDLGNSFITQRPVSIGLDDIKPYKDYRNKVLAAADVEAARVAQSTPGSLRAKQRKVVEVYDKASQRIMQDLEANKDRMPSTLVHMVKAGVKPNMDTLRQITVAPMLMVNAKGEVIPQPVRKSYAEGLDISDYWTSVSGARKGIIQKVQSVRDPGYLSKMVMNTVITNVVSADDCGTSKGVSLPLDEPDVMDRYLATDVKAGGRHFKAGTLVTPGVRDSLRNNKVNKVVVRSPLRCEHGEGLCAKCMGLDETGRLPPMGRNVGVLAGQSIGERATQLAMKSFHSGGAAPVGAKRAKQAELTEHFDRVQKLLYLSETLPNAAPLSTAQGSVTRISKNPAGGVDVYIGNERHYVPDKLGEPMFFSGGKPSRPLKKGDVVEKGVPLSAGLANPRQMLPLAGLNKTQNYLTNQLHDIYKHEGIKRRNVEVVVKSLTNLTRVKDPGDAADYLRGDLTSAARVQALNRDLVKQGKQPIQHQPVLKGVKNIPLDVQTDFLARLNHERISETLVDAANQGWSSDIHSNHPIPGLVYGAELKKDPPY